MTHKVSQVKGGYKEASDVSTDTVIGRARVGVKKGCDRGAAEAGRRRA